VAAFVQLPHFFYTSAEQIAMGWLVTMVQLPDPLRHQGLPYLGERLRRMAAR
jgi:hypothetical protein